MLAISTTTSLALVDPSTLRRPPLSLESSSKLSSPPTSTTWSPDGSSLFIAASNVITRYHATGELVKTVYTHLPGEGSHELIANLVAKDKGSLIFSAGSSVHFLEHSSSITATSRIAQTLNSPSNPGHIIGLSLSNDNTLLAAASASSVLIHNLSLSSHTILRGLPLSDGQSVSTCVFHPYSRIRLLLGIGRELVIYDITRPSGPVRTITMSEAATGEIVAIVCSPYSKTLLAVACSGGSVSVVDLDKEQGRIRSFNYKVPVTSLVFSPDGATLYIGCEDGKLLVQTLRTMDAPKTVTIGEHGHKIEGLAISKKSKSTDLAKITAAGVNKPLSQQDVNSPRRSVGKSSSVDETKKMKIEEATSPPPRGSTRSRVTSIASPLSPTTPVRKRVASTTAAMAKKAFSPVKELFQGSSSAENIASVDSAPLVIASRDERTASQNRKENVVKKSDKQPDTIPNASKPPSRVSTRSKPSAAHKVTVTASAPAGSVDKPPPRKRTTSMTARPRTSTEASPTSGGLRARTISAPKSPSSLMSKSPARTRADSTSGLEPPRTRTASVTLRTSPTSGAGSANTSPVQADRRSRTTSLASRPGPGGIVRTGSGSNSGKHSRTASGVSRVSVTRGGSPIPPVPQIPAKAMAQARKDSGSSASASARGSIVRTPSPTLPAASSSKEPFPVGAGQYKKKGLSMLGLGTPEVEKWIKGGKQRDKQREEGKRVDFVGSDEGDLVSVSKVEDVVEWGDTDAGLQAKEPLRRTMSMQLTPRRPGATSVLPSPLRHSVAGGSPGAAGSAQGILHALIKDAMLDFRQETKTDMVGLHLDLLRMGRSWRQEMRATMDEYVGDLKELRDENKRLRDENERLRRGY